MASLIPSLKKGGTPTLLDTEFGNRVIAAINALNAVTMTPEYGRMISDGKTSVKFDMSPLQAIIKDLYQKLSELNQGADLKKLIKRVDEIIDSIKESSISAACDETGTITVTLTFPNLPKKSTEE